MKKKEKIKTIWEILNKKKINYWKIITYIIYTFIIIFAVTAILSKFSIGGVKLLTVQSGSMEPKIKVGSLVFIKSQKNYQKNDIITFRTNASLKETTTHRIVKISQKNETTYFQTKGDANNAPDSQPVPKDWILGKVKFSIPYIGYPIIFARTIPGLIILIIIPATIIIYDEIIKIKGEVVNRRFVKRKRKVKNKKMSKKGK
jgi:signal peptidase